ncbi:MAG TPA: DNA polymerase IV, partial [Pedococcus sp.]|nr:DNA polymerase IV [Pedococcus sp.]
MSRRQYALPQRGDAGPPDDTGCTVLHVDMDAFYASASLLSRPELVGTPVIIGGGNRGVVLSATYEARRFGVASAMPMSRARRLCPQATVIAPDHALYARISAAVMATFDTITPVVEPLSLDEAFLDVSGSVRRLGNPARIGQLIRDTVHDEQGITCSVGVAPTKFVAKLASGLAKPDGMVVVPRDEVVGFVQQLPVGALWGVGDKTEEALVRLGLHTVADIAHTPLETLRRALGDSLGPHLHDLSWGRDPRHVEPVRREKSIGSDETFEHDVDDPAYIHRELLKL